MHPLQRFQASTTTIPKKADGSSVVTGNVIVRQRGTKIMAGKNVGVGKDHTLFALADGKVSFGTKRKTSFNNKVDVKKVADSWVLYYEIFRKLRRLKDENKQTETVQNTKRDQMYV